MAQQTPPPGGNNGPPDKKPKLPPDERFWKRYSPHHEFPLSGVTSFAVHGVTFALILVIGFYASRLIHDEPLPMEPIVIAGGGGSPDGEGNASGEGVPPTGKEAVPDPKEPVANKSRPVDPNDPIQVAKAPDVDIPEIDSSPNERVIGEASQAVKNLASVSKDVRNKMMQGLVRGKGQGGSGSGGGKGKGKGTGEGDLEGPGKSKMSQRQKRVLRWTMMFNTLNGDDYRRQLQHLGAILAIPARDGGYLVIRNLTPPAHGEKEDLQKIQRIFWVDDKPQSVGSLAQALGLRETPQHIVAFFPETLEAKLLRLEKAYQGKNEDEIKETRFEVDSSTYEPRVVDQR